MKNEFSYAGEMPQTVQSIGTPSNPLYQICFDTVTLETGTEENPITQYRSNYVQVSSLKYHVIVSAIVSSRYTSSDVEAILLNNMEASDPLSQLTEEKRNEYIGEYISLQEWRAHAKKIAGGIV